MTPNDKRALQALHDLLPTEPDIMHMDHELTIGKIKMVHELISDDDVKANLRNVMNEMNRVLVMRGIKDYVKTHYHVIISDLAEYLYGLLKPERPRDKRKRNLYGQPGRN